MVGCVCIMDGDLSVLINGNTGGALGAGCSTIVMG